MKLNKNNICMVVHANYKNDTRVRREAEALIGAGYSVDVISLNGGNDDDFELFAGVCIYRVNLSRSINRGKTAFILEYLSFFVRAMMKLSRLFIKKRYCLIFCHNIPNFLVFSTILPKLFGAKIVLDMHDTMPELYKLMFNLKDGVLLKLLYLEEKLSVWYADYCVTVNRTILELFTRRNNKEFFVLHNSTDPNTFGKPKEAYDKGGRPLKIIYHGIIHERYGLQRVVSVLASLKNKGMEIATLEVHGRGSYYNQIKQYAQDVDVSHLCTFNGEYYPEDISSRIKEADLGVVPNHVNEFSNILLPVKMLEYIHLKVPVLSSQLYTSMSYFDDGCVNYFDTDEDLEKLIIDASQNYQRFVDKTDSAYEKLVEISWQTESVRFIKFVDSVVDV
jgi:glycosyltransferase involved in cell wall biosynthesis